ncbi:hypothetical protein GCM10008018_33960 [Paenibacillus marchantiophytorum]|uniref:Uncharacterized protein n=1 Tax=Paenibacillus marchantiophytorum TaxID=1619310 RepID=A0ABQ1ESC4_9BACL|nr:hypothetical protein GCM10008018_33960 [Paenibacillus marchantiophytorum]
MAITVDNKMCFRVRDLCNIFYYHFSIHLFDKEFIIQYRNYYPLNNSGRVIGFGNEKGSIRGELAINYF